MAKFGAKYPCFAPIISEPADSLPVCGAGINLGGLVAANLTVNLASGELFSDDILSEQVAEFSSGTLAMETDDMADAVAAAIYGVTVTDGEVRYNKDDTAPYGSLAYYKVLMRKGVKYYQAYFYPKVRATLGNDNAQTKSSSITFQTTSTTLTVFAPEVGDWRITKTFDTEAAARAWVEVKTGVKQWHEMNVSVNGGDGGKLAVPLGLSYVEEGGTFSMEITGTVSKLYDNGVESASAIANGQYILNNVQKDHDIAVIF